MSGDNGAHCNVGGGGGGMTDEYTCLASARCCTLESLQGRRDLTEACVRDLLFLSREGRDLGVAFQAPPGYSCLENPMDGGAW